MMYMVDIEPGLRYWTAPHPDWRGSPDWPENVGCVYYEASDAVVLIDPLVPRDHEDEFWATLDADVERRRLSLSVLLSAPWHARSAALVAERFGAVVWSHSANSPELPAGVELFVPGGRREGQVAFYLRPHRALVVAEIFMGTDDGSLRVCPSPASSDAEVLDFHRSLRALLDLPIDYVLVSHGRPVLHDGGDRIADALGVHA